MPARLPKARASEIVSFGVGGVAALVPLVMVFAPETVARQTAHWAPRWEHVASNYLTPPAQHAVRHHVAPRAERTMAHVDRLANPHMERAAQHVDRRIRAGIERATVERIQK